MTGFAKGGPVSETGPAIVHKGEYVIPAGGGVGGITINIMGNLNGFNARDIANMLSEELDGKINI